MKINRLITFLFGLTLSACKSNMPDPNCSTKPYAFVEAVSKSMSEREKLVAKAMSGDAEAALELARHYSFAAQDDDKAEFWYKKAADNGGEKEKSIYESFMEGR
jgi:hypothetical protein